ncbi:MAG: CoA-binding protein [Myxococcota bacterium]
MYKQGLPGFKYYVGIRSLEDVATREDRVCVLNILGNESRGVTPTSHAFSGGNVVFGTAPGKKGQTLETRVGSIPVYNNVREGLSDGLSFNTGVIYLPPSAVRHGFYEFARVNPDLEKVVIITEKVPVHDAREIRAVAQQLGVDVFGANCLGVADAWNQVRLGGALGGDAPHESLKRGSVAIYSNSGNFTTTIASYIAMVGWGTTTLISSGKDLYVHFAAPEFAFAFNNDPRSKAAVMYVEPGGYYEQKLSLTKPVVACVVGRWKDRLTRPVGHAGAMAGSGDNAEAKIAWFKETLGVDGLYYPERPVYSEKGAVVDNIAHIPGALTDVMKLHGVDPDLEAREDMGLRPWFANDQGLAIPTELALPVGPALSPYDQQIQALDRQIGSNWTRTSMKDASSASKMDPDTQVTSLHGVSVLDLGQQPMESMACFAVLKTRNDASANAIANVLIHHGAFLHDSPALAAAEASREHQNPPNGVLAAAFSVMGPAALSPSRTATERLIQRFASLRLQDPTDETQVPTVSAEDRDAHRSERFDPEAERLQRVLKARGIRSVFLRFLERLDTPVSADTVRAAAALTLAWVPLRRKRISQSTAKNLPEYLRLLGIGLGASLPARDHGPDHFMGEPKDDVLEHGSFTDLSFRALMKRRPTESERQAYEQLIGLLTTNGPGTISSQGAKGSVSADGPETPDRVQIQQAMVGFLVHTGFSHGGNGYEGIAFLREQFEKTGLVDPGDPAHGLDLRAMVQTFALHYADQKALAKARGESARAIPGINHPVFRGQDENIDPREAYLYDSMARKGEYNVFHEYYRTLVRVLHEERVTPNVFAVNVDAVISAVLLKLLWTRVRRGEVEARDLEDGAFLLFLQARAIGILAEVDDHLNRGRNMDTRTPASRCWSVS